MLRKTILIIFFAWLLALTGCRKSQIESELKELNSKKALSQRKLDSYYNEYAALEKQSKELAVKAQIQRDQAAGLLKDNFMAVACMASVGYSLSKENLFWEEANQAINAGAVLCVAAAILSDVFRTQVTNLVAALEQSSNTIKNLETQIKSLKPEIDEKAQIWGDEKAVLDSLSTKIERLQTELRQLQ
jgi:chromosome segregation ATPase